MLGVKVCAARQGAGLSQRSNEPGAHMRLPWNSGGGSIDAASSGSDYAHPRKIEMTDVANLTLSHLRRIDENVDLVDAWVDRLGRRVDRAKLGSPL